MGVRFFLLLTFCVVLLADFNSALALKYAYTPPTPPSLCQRALIYLNQISQKWRKEPVPDVIVQLEATVAKLKITDRLDVGTRQNLLREKRRLLVEIFLILPFLNGELCRRIVAALPDFAGTYQQVVLNALSQLDYEIVPISNEP